MGRFCTLQKRPYFEDRSHVFPAFPTGFVKLPGSLIIKNDQTLKLNVLFLSCVDFTPPRGVTFSAFGFQFASLYKLSFTVCQLADTTLDLFLLKCVGLEVLVLDRCLGLANVNIRGSNLDLKQLVFKWCDYNDGVFRLLDVDVPGLSTLFYSGDWTKIRLNNCQGLLKLVLLGTQEQINEANVHHIRGLINQVTHVKDLTVNFELLQFRNECWDAFCDTRWETYEKPEFVEIEGAQEHQVHHGNRLEMVKSIRVRCFSGFYGEMMLLRLLLEKAVKLQKLELFWRIHVWQMGDNVLQIVHVRREGVPDLVAKLEEEKDAIEEEVNSFPRAPTAELIFYPSWRWETGYWESFGLPVFSVLY
ncbi:hypothetical protein REPUB_Repub17cG0042800 [Reevesia pubescens]